METIAYKFEFKNFPPRRSQVQCLGIFGVGRALGSSDWSFGVSGCRGLGTLAGFVPGA